MSLLLKGLEKVRDMYYLILLSLCDTFYYGLCVNCINYVTLMLSKLVSGLISEKVGDFIRVCLGLSIDERLTGL